MKIAKKVVGKMIPNVKINVENVEELQELLGRVATLSNELQETLQQINKFELVVNAKRN